MTDRRAFLGLLGASAASAALGPAAKVVSSLTRAKQLVLSGVYHVRDTIVVPAGSVIRGATFIATRELGRKPMLRLMAGEVIVENSLLIDETMVGELKG